MGREVKSDPKSYAAQLIVENAGKDSPFPIEDYDLRWLGGGSECYPNETDW